MCAKYSVWQGGNMNLVEDMDKDMRGRRDLNHGEGKGGDV